MNIFYRRPFMLSCACFLAVSALAFCLDTIFKQILIAVLAIAVALSVLLAILLRKNKAVFIKAIVFIIALSFSLTAAFESFYYFDVYAASTKKYIGQNCKIVATVVEERRATAYDSAYIVSLETLNGEDRHIKALLCLDIPAGLHEGSVVELTAECVDLEDISYSDTYIISCIAEGITAGFSVEDSDNVEINELYNSEDTWAPKDLNSTLSRRLENGIGDEPGRLAAAMLLGNRHLLSPETTRDFARTGISHILSLSGLHMALLTGFFELILRLFRVPKSVRSCLMPIVMLGYLILTGFELPALRAAIMLTVVYISFLAASPSDIITVLFATCAAIVAFIPSSAADVGFWMSFLATMGIIVISPHVSKLFRVKKRDGSLKSFCKRLLRYFVSAVAVTVTAVLSVVFVTWICFGELSLLSPIANLYASPLTTVMMVLSSLYIMVGGIPILGNFLADAASGVGKLMLDLTEKLSDIRGATVSLRYGFATVIIISLCASMAVLLIIRLRKKILVMIPPALAVIAFAICLIVTNYVGSDSAELTYLRRGEREMMLFSQNGRAVLCDMTDGTYSNHVAAWQIAQEKECATELEVLILTHYHDKHRGSAERLFSSVKVRSLWIPIPADEKELLISRELMRIADEHGVVCSIYRPGESLRVFGDCKVIVSPSVYFERSSQPSLMIEFSGPNNKTVYLGSSYLEAAAAPNNADTVIFGTHGPNPKCEYDLGFAENAKNLVFADEELFGLSKGIYEGNVTKNCDYIRVEN